METCDDNCPSGMYEYEDNNECLSCTGNNDPSLCGSCADDYFLYETTCEDSCPDGYDEDSTNNSCTSLCDEG